MKKKWWIAVGAVGVIAVLAAVFVLNYRIDAEGKVFRVYSAQDISMGAYAEGAEKFAREYGCRVEFTDVAENCDLIYTSEENFSDCQPIDEYINPKNKLYTKKIIDNSCTKNGKIYGITNVLAGRINYCAYNPGQFDGITSPYEYYRQNRWTWESFINMGNDLGSNISVNWNEDYINMMYALKMGKDGKTEFNYGTQEQVEWLNFVRTLIFDEGIVGNGEGALKIGFLPDLALEAINSGMQLRYIPWATKNGKLGSIFVDEYHFSVPEGAQDVKASVELANYMLESFIDVRMNLYKSQMTEEDFKIFKKQLSRVYTFPPRTFEHHVPTQLFIDDFIHGKTVTEHIFNVENDAQHIK